MAQQGAQAQVQPYATNKGSYGFYLKRQYVFCKGQRTKHNDTIWRTITKAITRDLISLPLPLCILSSTHF